MLGKCVWPVLGAPKKQAWVLSFSPPRTRNEESSARWVIKASNSMAVIPSFVWCRKGTISLCNLLQKQIHYSLRLIHFKHDKAWRSVDTLGLPSTPFKCSPEPHSQLSHVLSEQDMLLPVINTALEFSLENQMNKYQFLLSFPPLFSLNPLSQTANGLCSFCGWVREF